MINISYYSSAKDASSKETIVFEQYLQNIKNGTWQDAVIAVRRERQRWKAGQSTKEAYQEIKKKAPAVTASGQFNYRDAQNLIQHSGFLAIDFDVDLTETIDRYVLEGDQYSYAVHQSIGGDGLVVYVKIEAERHLEAFLALEQYYANHYKLTVDKSCKDVNRLRYVSMDSELFVNQKSKLFKTYLPKAKQQPSGKIYTQTSNDIEHIIKQVVERGIDLTFDYYNWIEIGFGFAREYGEGGRQYFHDVSGVSSKYNYADCDKKYTNLLNKVAGGSSSGRKSGVGTFVWLAAQAGVETKSQRTTFIESAARSRRAMVGQNGGFKDIPQAKEAVIHYLKEMENIEGEDVAQVVEKVMQMPFDQIKSTMTGDLVQDAKNYIKTLPLRFNEVTQAIEYNGEIMTDIKANTLYLDTLDVLKNVQKKELSKKMFDIIIDSDLIEKYNPFLEFFQKNNQENGSDLVDEVLSCIIFTKDTAQEEKDEILYFVWKWLVSIVMSMHGTYSILCLVLCGRMGKGKTEFLRGLLPKELQIYFNESKLDAGKDDEILMTQSLMLCDDEFSGKSKQDAKKMRELLAKQFFTVRAPYARRASKLRRYAVLCGTSNERDVLSDLEGNRRIIPVNIERIDFERFKKIDKNRLLMQLYNIWLEIGSEGVFLTDEDIERLKKLTESNEEVCIELEAFFMFFDKVESHIDEMRGEWLTPTELKAHIEKNTTLRLSIKRLGAALKKVGIEPKSKKINGFAAYRYLVLRKNPTETNAF